MIDTNNFNFRIKLVTPPRLLECHRLSLIWPAGTQLFEQVQVVIVILHYYSFTVHVANVLSSTSTTSLLIIKVRVIGD